jgi:hypothetical protein
MSAEPLSIVPRLPDTEASQNLVEILKVMLAEAEEGELVGGVFCVYDRARTTVTTMVLGENPTLLLGQVAAAQHRLARAIDLIL